MRKACEHPAPLDCAPLNYWLAESGPWTVNQSATDLLPQSCQAPLCLSECGAGMRQRMRPIKCEQTYRHYRLALSQRWSCQQRRKWNLQQATRDYSFRCNELPGPLLSLYSGTAKFRQNVNTTWQRNDSESIHHRSTELFAHHSVWHQQKSWEAVLQQPSFLPSSTSNALQ